MGVWYFCVEGGVMICAPGLLHPLCDLLGAFAAVSGSISAELTTSSFHPATFRLEGGRTSLQGGLMDFQLPRPAVPDLCPRLARAALRACGSAPPETCCPRGVFVRRSLPPSLFLSSAFPATSPIAVSTLRALPRQGFAGLTVRAVSSASLSENVLRSPVRKSVVFHVFTRPSFTLTHRHEAVGYHYESERSGPTGGTHSDSV